MDKASAVILAGGKSQRMGCDKGQMCFKGKPMLDYSLEVIKMVTDDTMISTSNNLHKRAGCRTVEDVFPGCGPASGIHAALRAAKYPWLWVVSADMPFLSINIYDQMFIRRKSHGAVVPRWSDGKIEPLCALYHRSALIAFEESLKLERYKMQEIIRSIHPRWLYIEEHPWMIASRCFFNINTPDDLHDALVEPDQI